MSRRVPAIAFTFLCAVSAMGQTFDARVDDAYRLLREGQAEAAMKSFLDLQLEAPDAAEVQYGIAGAKYIEALEQMNEYDPAPGLQKMQEVKAEFDEIVSHAESHLAGNARLAAANSSAEIARHSTPLQDFEETIIAFEQSIRAYRDILVNDPGNIQAKKNLNHVSYGLKRLLQDRPPEQQQQQQDGDEGEDGNQGDQGEGGDQGDQNREGEDPSEQSDEGQDSEDDGDPEERDGEVGQGHQTEADMEQNPLSRQNIEAILRSLEELNKEEQKNMRRSKTAPRMEEGKWW